MNSGNVGNIDIFAILGLEPTDDFTKVKKAYYRKALAFHPDRNFGNEENAEVEFKKVQNAYDLVDDEQKLKRYYRLHVDGNQSQFFDEVFPGDFKRDSSREYNPSVFGNEQTDAIYIPKQDIVNIFIPVMVNISVIDSDQALANIDLNTFDSDDSEEILFPLHGHKLSDNNQGQEFADHFDFALLAKVITNMSKTGLYQVGVTDNEAVKIVDQHSYRVHKIIVEVQVSLTRISENRFSEKDLNRNMLNAKSEDYFWLAKDTVFELTDIISARTMRDRTYNHGTEYQNTCRFGKEESWPREIWPNGTTLLNPYADTTLQLTATKRDVNSTLLLTTSEQDESSSLPLISPSHEKRPNILISNRDQLEATAKLILDKDKQADSNKKSSLLSKYENISRWDIKFLPAPTENTGKSKDEISAKLAISGLDDQSGHIKIELLAMMVAFKYYRGFWTDNIVQQEILLRRMHNIISTNSSLNLTFNDLMIYVKNDGFFVKRTIPTHLKNSVENLLPNDDSKGMFTNELKKLSNNDPVFSEKMTEFLCVNISDQFANKQNDQEFRREFI